MVSGVGMYMKNMAAALVQCGHQAIVVTASSEGKRSETVENGVVVCRVFSREERGSERVRDIVLQIARDHRVDIIEGADHGGDCASLLRLKRQIPVMIKYHACQMIDVLRRAHAHYWWQNITIGAAMLKSWRQMRDEIYSIEHADFACVPSKRLLEELRKQSLSLPEKLAVIPNPIAVSTLPEAVEPEEPTVLFVGRIEFGKGAAFLPDLIRNIVLNFPKARLEIAGSDSYARGVGSLKEWVSDRLGSASGNVQFLGPLGAVELEAAYRRAWVVVVPSLWDNFPTVVLEAMSLARPIVASIHGGMPEMLEGTGCPVVEPAGDGFAKAVARLLGDKKVRDDVGRRARRRALSVYSPEVVVAQYVKYVQSCL